MPHTMDDHPRPGSPVGTGDLAEADAILTNDPGSGPTQPHDGQLVMFGTSRHGTALIDASLCDQHVAAVSQAICDYRRDEHITGPLFIGRDTDVLYEPVWQTAVEVFAANDVAVFTDSRDHITPTPALSRAIVRHNHNGLATGMADGLVIKPSPGPPYDRGFTYRGVDGGPASAAATTWINRRAGELLAGKLRRVKRVSFSRAMTQSCDVLGGYVDELGSVVDLEAIRRAGMRLCVEPLGGSSQYWQTIAERHGLDVTLSSTHGPGVDIGVGTDAEAVRHTIMTEHGPMNPNHYLAIAVDHLVGHRAAWSPYVAVGKTVVSTSMIDRIAAGLGRTVVEVPIGFGWFAPGLIAGRLMFAGDHGAGATCLRSDGSPWTTDGDGIAMALLAAEIMAVTSQTPSQRYAELASRHGSLTDAQTVLPATPDVMARAARLSGDDVTATELAGDPIDHKITVAAGNGKLIGGMKVVTAGGWFVARPSENGTGVTIHAESSRGAEHVARIQAEARDIVTTALDR